MGELYAPVTNMQEAYEKSTQALLKQECRSLVQSGSIICAYRGENQTKCAVGFLISDAHYHEGLESNNVADFDVQEAVRKSNPEWDITDNDFSLLQKLQLVHDDDIPHTWANTFENMKRVFLK